MVSFVVITFDLLTCGRRFNTQVIPLENESGDALALFQDAFQQLNKANDPNLTSDPRAEKLPEWRKTPESQK
jgi:hypothetical protein